MSTLDNLIEISFTATEIQKLEDALDTIEQVLSGKVVNLTPEERISYGRVNNKTEDWIRKIDSYMNQKPQLIPFYLNKANFDKDLKAREELKPWLDRVASINESMQDTSMLLGADIYNAAIAYYRNIKIIAQQNVPGTTSIYQDLQEQFPGRPSTVLETPEPHENTSEERVEDNPTPPEAG